MTETLNFHAIIGPNGMCMCGVDAHGTVTTCGQLLKAYMQEQLAAENHETRSPDGDGPLRRNAGSFETPTGVRNGSDCYAIGAQKAGSEPAESHHPQADYWRCRTCGCLWRDNHDNTVSLSSAKQTSCSECEPKPVAEACDPLVLAASVNRGKGKKTSADVTEETAMTDSGTPALSRMTDADLDQIIIGIKYFIIGDIEDLVPLWQPYIDKLNALRRRPPLSETKEDMRAAMEGWRALITRVVTGDGAQLENLDMTEDEWNEGAGITEDGKDIEITMRREDWFDLIRAAGGTVRSSKDPVADVTRRRPEPETVTAAERTEETVAWLVALGSSPPQWWTGRGPNEWTLSVDGTSRFPADCAMRFARREDAERAIGWLVKEGVRDGCKAEGHIWLADVTRPRRPLDAESENK